VRRQPSLTLRASLAFAVVAMLTVGGAGMYLYHSLQATLLQRSDYGVLARLDHFRKLLHYDLSLEQLQASPQLVENMLGAEDDIFLIGVAGQPPLINVNPRGAALPALQAVADGEPLGLADLRSGVAPGDVPLRAAEARVQLDGRDVRITAAHLLVKEMAMLETFRWRIGAAVVLAFLLTAALGFLLLRRGLRPLRRIAEQAAAITPARLHSRLQLADTPVELSQLSQAFNAMLERLDDGYRRLTQFSADLAHEIRTPVGSLMGTAQVTLQQPRSVDEYQGVLASSLDELERIARMVESILFLARADDAQAVLDLRELELEEEIQRIVAYFEGLADERQLQVRHEGGGRLRADPMLLRRALSNLVANAIRYADAGSEILIRVREEQGACLIQVENGCSPLHPGQLERLFDRFYRADLARQGGESNGLGLAIVAAIMRLHGGSVSVSQDGARRIRFELRFNVA